MEEPNSRTEKTISANGESGKTIKKTSDCPSCREMLGVMVASTICEKADKAGLDCSQLANDLKEKKITPQEFIDKLKIEFESSSQEHQILEKIEKVIDQ